MPLNTTPKAARYEIAELAEVLGISLSKLYAEIRANRIPHIKLQRRIILPRVAIEKWMENCGETPRTNLS